VAKTREEVANLQQRDANDVREVMSTEAGRRFVYRLIDRAGVYRCSFNGQSNSTIFNEGGRNQGLMLLTDITVNAPGAYQQMLKENNDE
jgi:hypothetical protein